MNLDNFPGHTGAVLDNAITSCNYVEMCITEGISGMWCLNMNSRGHCLNGAHTVDRKFTNKEQKRA